MRYDSDEPLSIDHDVVADYLDRMRKPGMAEFVRHLGGCVQEANRREMRVRELYNALAARLEQYEPSEPRSVVNHQPPPEASD